MKRIDGLPVHNASMPIRLEVTAEDIKEGARKNANACAVAIAACRQIRGVTAAKVHLGVVYLMQNGKWRRWHTPDCMRTEIVVFDRGGRFVPGEYYLMPVPPSVLGKKSKRSNGNMGHNSRRRRHKPHMITDVRDSARGNDEKRS